MRVFHMKKLLLVVTALVGLAGMTVLAAHPVPDLTRTGSVTIRTQKPDTGEAVTDGELTLYQAGDVLEQDGNYSFVLTDEFGGSGRSLEDIGSSELAEALAEYAAGNGLTGLTGQPDGNGAVVFKDLKPGLYLAVQTKASDGYYAVSPFLVSLPALEDGAYVYQVDATPKMEPLAPAPSDPESPSDSGSHSGSGSDPEPTVSAGTLPQTGQLNWPVPVLAVSGLLLFAFGWLLSADKRKRSYAE